MPDIRAWKRQVLEKSLEKLFQDYEAAINQRDRALAAQDQNRLQREADEIWEQIVKQNSELESLELAPTDDAVTISKPDAASIQEKLRSNLHEIDFKELEKTIEIILRDHRDGGCAALLLFQESDKRGGDWCAARIRKLLRRVTDEGKRREITVEFRASEQANSMELLRRIGQYLGIEGAGHDLSGLSQIVVQKLCGSLRNGSVVMIQCQRCDDICRELDEFRRMLEDFWRNVVKRLSLVSAQYCEVKVIVLLFTDKLLPDDCLVDYCCTIDQFQKDRLLKLPQEEWSQEDIQAWIACYSGLDDLPLPEINRMAKNIYESADGLPIVVAHKLLQECCLMTAG